MRYKPPGTTTYETVRDLSWDGMKCPAGTLIHVLAENQPCGSGTAHAGLVEDPTRSDFQWFRFVTVRPKDVKKVE